MTGTAQPPHGGSVLSTLALGLALVAAAAGADRARAADAAPPLRVLIYSGLNNHDWRSTTPVLRALLAGCPRFGQVEVIDDPTRLDTATLAGYDVIVSNWTPYPDTRRIWSPETEAAFLDFIRQGGGFVVIHAAACTFQVWPDFQELIALTWKADYTAHGAYHTFKVAVADPQHPIARGLTDFYTTDELYHNMVHLAGTPLQVVFTAFSAKDQGGTGKDEPMLVCTGLGQGRGVNLVLGHDAGAMGAGFKTLLQRSAEWAATGAVTIPPPALWPETPAAMAAAGVDADTAFAALTAYRYGDARQPLHDVEQLVRYADGLAAADPSGYRQRLLERLAALLTSTTTTAAAKVFLCAQFAVLATADQALLLQPVLTDPEVAPAALDALAQIPGPAVDRLLREAVKGLPGDLRLSPVHALGQRRDDGATEALAALLQSADEPLAGAAAKALGEIGSEAAGAALQTALSTATGALRAAIADACLVQAEHLLNTDRGGQAAACYARLSGPDQADPIRMAALRGLTLADPAAGTAAVCAALCSGDPALESMAIQCVPEVADATATAAFAACLGKVSTPMQALLLAALARRGDAAARGPVEAMATSADPAVRRAALVALGALGDETTVSLLLTQVLTSADTADSAAARDSLVRLRTSRANRALIDLLASGNARAKVEIIRLLAARRAVDARPDLQRLAADPEAAVRLESWKALGALARADDAPALLDLLERARDDERDEAEKTVGTVLRGPTGGDVLLPRLAAAAAPAVRAALVRVASSLGDDRLLPALRQALQSTDASVRDAAIRGLAAWPSAAPLTDLVGLAGHATDSVHRVLALRGAIRLSSQADGRNPEQMVRLVGELMQLAGAAAERKAVLAELGRCPTLAALELAGKYLADPELATEAGVAITQIAAALRDSHRDRVLEVLAPLLAADRDPAVSARAGKQLLDILKPANLALGARADSPDNVDADGASGGDVAAIDGDPRTYWDEVNGSEQYRLRVTFPAAQEVTAVNLLWHPYEQHQAKNLDILCDGRLAAPVRDRRCLDHDMFIALAPVRCTTVELVIPGRNGLVSPAIHELQVFGRFAPESATTAPPRSAAAPAFAWQQTPAGLALLNHGRTVWQCHYAADLAKPYFHPLALLDGTVLTAPSPADHPWHRALWFSWKLLNGVNYWEEDPATGRAQGLTEVVSAQASPGPNGAARIEMTLSYHPPNAPPVLTESRLIAIGAPDAKGAYRLDWRGTFSAGDRDLRLEGGSAGGGYAGLSVRVSQASSDWVLIDSEGRRDVPTDSAPGQAAGLAANTHGQRARWADFALVDEATQQPGGIAILDHPTNPRHPALWHNIMAAKGRFGYFSPALLWSEPYTLAAGQQFALRYRIIVHPGGLEPEAIEREWREFAAPP